MKIYCKWILILCCCSMLKLSAQDDVLFQHLSRKEGLSQVSVFAIAQDSSGLMWFGTRNGLNRYDGYQFKIYNKDTTSNCLVADDIRALYVDPLSKNLWIGTISGLSKYDLSADLFSNFYHAPTNNNSLSNNEIRQILRDARGRLWIATSMGINLYNDDTGEFTRFFIEKKSSKKNISQDVKIILEDSAGQIWLGTGGGLYRLVEEKNGSFDFERVDESLNLNLSEVNIKTMVEDTKGNFWIGTLNGGLNYWNRKTGNTKVYKHDKNNNTSLSHNSIRSMCLDENDNLWIGTFDGLNFLKNNQSAFKIFKPKEFGVTGISDNSIHSITYDKRGSLWVGTYYGGVNRLDKNHNRFTNYKNLPVGNALNKNVVSSFAEDENGNLYIGTEGKGLHFYDQEKNKFISFQDPKVGNSIKQLLLDKDQLWIGTFQSGLNRFDLKTKQFHQYKKDPKNPNSISSNSIYGMHKAGDKIWILTYGNGLDILDLKTNTFYNYNKNIDEPNSISSDLTRVALETNDKQIWIGTDNGLNKVTENEDGLPVKFEVSFPGEKIYSLQKSYDQSIWIGTFTNGLYHLNPSNNEIQHFTMADGLSGNSIFGILEVNTNEVWLSTNNGISKFNVQEKSFTSYDYSSGIANLEHNFNAYYETRSGDLLFGGIHGFTRFNPKNIQTNTFIPPIVFTQLQQNNKVVNIHDGNSCLEKNINHTEEIRLNYNEANFSISFAALDYFSPENNRYAYMLDGLDRNWNYTIGKTEANYSIQREGTYLFKVKGANSDGLWNNEERHLKVVVLPPPWKTWWAYLLYACILAAVFYGLLRVIRLQHKLQLEQIAKEQQKELHEVKLRFFTNITHEFRTPLTLILGPLKELIKKEKHTEEVKGRLSLIETNAQRLLNLVNQVLTFRKLATDHEPMKNRKENIVFFLKEIFLSYQETAQLRNIQYGFETEAEEISAWFDADKLEKVFYNLLSNAFNFTSDGGNIQMTISQNNQEVTIKVKDSGPGIADELKEQIFKRFYEKSTENRSTIKGTGIGLAISKQMIELHQGKIFVEKQHANNSSPKGATLVVKIPIGKVLSSQEEIAPDFSTTAVQPDIVPAMAPPQNASLVPAEETQPESEEKPLLLIVEDNPDVLTYIQQIFADQYRLILAEDGAEGLKKAKKHLPQLIISDVMMPVMDGITFSKKVKLDFEISHIPIILLTARTASLFKIEGLKTGADDYVTKPFDPEELSLRVHNIIQARENIRTKFARVLTLDPKEINVTSADEQFLEKALQIVEKHMDNYEFNVNQFAFDLAVSRPLLFTKLKALTGQTPNNFIKTIRLKRAAQLLKGNKINVSEVAYKVGFKDPKYFRKCFKEQFKMLPSDFGKSFIG